MRISAAADLVGVPTHVLRHWEDEGVLAPSRSGTNQREFSTQQVDAARIVHRLREAGVGLAQIRELLPAQRSRRSELLSAEADRLERSAIQSAAAARFLRHVGRCRHPVIEDCPECRSYATFERTD